MSRPQLISLVGGPGAACEGDGCLPSDLPAAGARAEHHEDPRTVDPIEASDPAQ